MFIQGNRSIRKGTLNGRLITKACVGSNDLFPTWLESTTKETLLIKFGQSDGPLVITAAESYLDGIASSNSTRAQDLADYINEDPMTVCSLGLEPQGMSIPMPMRMIKFTGSQYFLVGLSSTQVDEVEYDLVPDGYSGHIVCNTRSSSSNGYRIYFSLENNNMCFHYNTTTNSSLGPMTMNKLHHVKSTIKNYYQRLEVDGSVIKTDSKSMHSTSTQNTIGAWNGAGSISAKYKGLLGQIVLRKDDADVRQYVPFKRNNVFGMIDLLHDTLYTNAGSGSFSEIYGYMQNGSWVTWTPSNS